MKILSVILCGVFLIGTAQSLWAADPEASGDQQSPAQNQAEPQSAQPGSTATAETNIKPHYKDGKPMTAEEFAKANEARMKARTQATQSRLEARQARWKKVQDKSVAQKPAVNKTASPNSSL